MNWINHFLFSFNILYLIYHEPIWQIVLFTIIFALGVDFDFITRRYVFGTKGHDLRTFVQEPFGVLLIGGAIGIILSLLFGWEYLGLVLIPYASHIFLDYIGEHKVWPLAPFSKKSIRVCVFKRVRPWRGDMFNFREFNENWFMAFNAIIFVLVIF